MSDSAAPAPKHSDDRPHAPWCISAPHGTSVYRQHRPPGIPPDSLTRKPYHSCCVPLSGLWPTTMPLDPVVGLGGFGQGHGETPLWNDNTSALSSSTAKDSRITGSKRP